MFNFTKHIPCFFIDSCFNRLNICNKYSYDVEDRNTYQARLKTFYGTLINMNGLETIKVVERHPVIESERIETRIIEVRRDVRPIMGEMKVRRDDLQGLIDLFGSRYKYVLVQKRN